MREFQNIATLLHNWSKMRKTYLCTGKTIFVYTYLNTWCMCLKLARNYLHQLKTILSLVHRFLGGKWSLKQMVTTAKFQHEISWCTGWRRPRKGRKMIERIRYGLCLKKQILSNGIAAHIYRMVEKKPDKTRPVKVQLIASLYFQRVLKVANRLKTARGNTEACTWCQTGRRKSKLHIRS